MFEPQRRVGCRRTRRENEANAVLFGCFSGIGACSCSCSCHVIWLVPCIATLHEPDHTLHAPVSTRKHGVGPPHHLTTSPPHHLTTSPPHHLTTSPHDGERNTRTRQRRAAMNSAPKRSSSFIIWLVMSTASYCGSKASFTSQIPRCTLRCPHGSTSLVPASSSYRVCEFVW